MKLKHTEIKTYREQQLKAQGELCALCGEKIDGDAVLDHDHKTGLVRRVLHRGCNALLGKIENNLARNKITPARLQGIAQNLITYVTAQHTEILHPKHGAKRRRTRRR
jgi:hypothetical protein